MKSDMPKDNTMQTCIAATEEVIARINRLVDRTTPLEPEQLTEELTAAVDRLRETLRGMEELEDMQQADRALADFPTRLAHDMRTLLNGIVGLLEICGQHPDDRQLIDASRAKARVAASHLMSLVNDTLELSKLEKRDVPLPQEVFHLPTLLKEVETLAHMRAEEAGVEIICRTSCLQLKYPCLLGSPLYVKQVLLNILTNAIKYNRPHGTVFCALEEKPTSDSKVALHITICDTGVGMEQDFLQEIFKPYVQADAVPQGIGMGAGLGMAIVKTLLERMHGAIRIESKVDVGTTVYVTLPFAIAEQVPVKDAPKKPKGSLRGMHILLAENDELNREIAAFILKDTGAIVTEAANGREALALFTAKPPHYFDVVLMDIPMPEMDGCAAARAIRHCGKPDAETIPILAMTANAFDDDRQKSLSAGMNDYLSKPLDIPKLTEAIQKFRTTPTDNGGLVG